MAKQAYVERIHQRHHDLLKLYQSQKKSSRVSLDDLALVKQHFQFVRDEEADREQFHDNWVIRMSIAYYQRLFREYAIVDLRFYKENRIGMRWRTEMEVLQGKGQFVCANRTCKEASGLHSYEVLFRYKEEDQVKRCLVKVRVCEDCALKFFYRKLKRKRKEMKKLEAGLKTASPKSSKKQKLISHVEESVAISDVHAMCSAVHQDSKDAPPGNKEENQCDAGHQQYLTELFL